MDYRQTIDYLYAHLPMFSRIGVAAYKADLYNTLALCEALGNPQNRFKSIHIAGTNGKGSTSHMLAAMLQEAGYKTGLYTSPHLRDFRERIRINGEMVSEEFVVGFVENTRALSESILPSFFELTVAMAFEYFAVHQVDVAVIETGMGGRLDSTNVITPVLSVITNIGYDHTKILGDTLEKIAFEKAGIIKKGVPVVIGECLPETKPVFVQKASSEGAPIRFAMEEFEVSDIHCETNSLECNVRDKMHNITERFVLDLNGIYQTRNLCTVLCAEGLLAEKGFAISNEAEKRALAHTKSITGFHGRWDLAARNPDTYLDVAHNEDGILQLLQQPDLIKKKGRAHFVMGMVNDKDITKVLSLLPKEATYYFTNAHIPRAMPHQDLMEKARGYGLQGESFDEVNDALKKARTAAGPEGLVIVCGSVFVVGEVDPSLFS